MIKTGQTAFFSVLMTCFFFLSGCSCDNVGSGDNGENNGNGSNILEAPSSLSASALASSTSEIILTWEDNSDSEDGFRIERRLIAEEYSEIITVVSGVTTYKDTGLATDTEYYYHVRAYRGDDNSNYSNEVSATTLKESQPESAQSLTQFGITWEFDKEYDTGQFANGDYWVVGPVTIIGIAPPSREILGVTTLEGFTAGDDPDANIRIMNGSMINPSPTLGTKNGYDNEMYAWHPTGGRMYADNINYDSSLNVVLNVSSNNPLVIQPNNSLVSIKSIEAGARPQLQSAAILTVLESAPPEGSFRPSYCGADKQIKYNMTILDYNKLAKLNSVEDTPGLKQNSEDQQSDSVERMFERPWLDHVPDWQARFHHPAENMPDYGREMAAQIGEGALMLHLDFTDTEKETLLVRFIQLGIDLYGIVEDGGENNWVPTGGITMGRKWPILFAGVMLNDDDMKNIGQRSDVYFGEDGQTFYVSEESVTITNGEDWAPDDRGGPIEPYVEDDIGLPEWGIRHSTNPYVDNKHWTANYRRCCTANSWAGFILAAHIMGLKDLWNHDALFDYQDRYMSIGEYDSYMRQWSDFTENMWDTYRADYGCVWTRTDPDDEYSLGEYDCGE